MASTSTCHICPLPIYPIFAMPLPITHATMRERERNPMESTDVLVIGSGIAGLCAAIEAARAGATVAIACAGKTMSGSSFFPGTWGLGLIGPVDKDDEQDLIDTIQTVGGGVADPELVQTFVHGIPQAIDWLEQDLGVELQRPQSAESAQQKQFIPCFDHKTRMWRGLTRKPLEDACTAQIDSLGIRLLPRHELIDLVEDTNGKIVGAVLFNQTDERIVTFTAKATIIAAGGTGGLFERSLTSADVLSSSQAIARSHGASLTNIEFMQMMPGFIEPKRNLVFNEKTWRYVKFDQPVDIAESSWTICLNSAPDMVPSLHAWLPAPSILPSIKRVPKAWRSTTTSRERMSPSSCRHLPLGYKTSMVSLRATRYVWRCMPTPLTAVSRSTRPRTRALRASTPVARQQAACTAPTASEGCRAPMASYSGVSRAHRRLEQHWTLPRLTHRWMSPSPSMASLQQSPSANPLPQTHNEHLLHDQQDRTRPIRGASRA